MSPHAETEKADTAKKWQDQCGLTLEPTLWAHLQTQEPWQPGPTIPPGTGPGAAGDLRARTQLGAGQPRGKLGRELSVVLKSLPPLQALPVAWDTAITFPTKS